jgi:hypothetical protein
MADPQMRAVYEAVAARQKRRAFNVAVSDYYKRNILLSGE